jgi:hypothetical protein
MVKLILRKQKSLNVKAEELFKFKAIKETLNDLNETTWECPLISRKVMSMLLLPLSQTNWHRYAELLPLAIWTCEFLNWSEGVAFLSDTAVRYLNTCTPDQMKKFVVRAECLPTN